MPPKRAADKRSKLAKEANITSAEEAEIRESFDLFAEPRRGIKEGVMPIGDVRRAMIALNLPPSPDELPDFISILDPEDEGFTFYPPFLEICALKLHQRIQAHDREQHDQEVDEAFSLFLTPPGATSHRHSNTSSTSFTRGGASSSFSGRENTFTGGGGVEGGIPSFTRGDSWISVGSTEGVGAGGSGGQRERVITMANLRRIATILKEEVDEGLLRDMVLEANGCAGAGRGVVGGIG